MPKIANTVEKVAPITDETKEDTNYDSIIKENQDLKSKLDMLLDKFSILENKVNETVATDTKTEVPTRTIEKSEDIEYTDPLPNKQIKIMSLYYGSLNLATEIGGSAKYTFNKYGQIKPVLYSTLTEIVNVNRKFVENGSLYILDKNAVYSLGLSEVYKEILTKDIIDNICEYSVSDINSILDNITDAQKDIMIYNLRMKIFNGEIIDYNKLDVINKKFGVDIMSQVNEMKDFGNTEEK